MQIRKLLSDTERALLVATHYAQRVHNLTDPHPLGLDYLLDKVAREAMIPLLPAQRVRLLRHLGVRKTYYETPEGS